MLEALLYPRSVAIIGASRNPAKVGHTIVARIIDGGFEGEIIPVNPNATEILGVKSYKSLTEYKGQVDLAVIAVPANKVKDAVRDTIKAGVKTICIITTGFKENGHEGEKLQDEIVNYCKSAGVRLLGPNVIGIINTHHKLNATFATRMSYKGNISLISQCGAICTILLDWAYERKIGLANLIDIGNKGDLDEVDFIKALLLDDQTKVILCYLEDIRNGDEFIKTTQAVAGKKPIIILKAGVTEAGARAAIAHTGSHAGVDIAYGAAFRRSGIIRAVTIVQLLDYAIAFAMQPLPKGENVAIITNAGGPGTITTDNIENVGLKVKPLSDEFSDILRKKLPPQASINNPINLRMDASTELYIEAFNIAQDDPGVDAIVCLCAPQAVTSPITLAEAIIKNARHEKPVLTIFMGECEMKEARDKLITNNIPSYESPTRAAASLKAMWDYAQWLKRPPRVVTRFPVNRQRVERIISRQLKIGQFQVNEIVAKDILSAYGFIVPAGQIAYDAGEAIDIAERIGYPIAMKIVSPHIIHKSDIGGVRLNLANSQEIEDAFEFMMHRVQRKSPKAKIDGVYVEKMCPRDIEIILGVRHAPQFGPMLMFGLGGIYVEVMEDVTFHLAPITADEAMQMLRGTRSYAILESERDRTSVNLDSISVALQIISQLVTDFPEIQELNISPYIVGEVGKDSFVADASMILSDVGRGL